MTPREWLVATACVAVATAGLALFVVALDVGKSSLARSVPPIFAWRTKDPNARPLPDAPSPRTDRVQR